MQFIFVVFCLLVLLALLFYLGLPIGALVVAAGLYNRTKPIKIGTVRVEHAPRRIIACGAVIAVMGCFGLAQTFKDKAADKAASVADEQADKNAAAEMGVSYETYRLGLENEVSAWSDCKRAAASQAEWSASSDFLPSYSWSINGDTIHISGSDLKMKNGFGGERHVSYQCDWSITSKQATVLSVS